MRVRIVYGIEFTIQSNQLGRRCLRLSAYSPERRRQKLTHSFHLLFSCIVVFFRSHSICPNGDLLPSNISAAYLSNYWWSTVRQSCNRIKVIVLQSFLVLADNFGCIYSARSYHHSEWHFLLLFVVDRLAEKCLLVEIDRNVCYNGKSI